MEKDVEMDRACDNDTVRDEDRIGVWDSVAVGLDEPLALLETLTDAVVEVDTENESNWVIVGEMVTVGTIVSVKE